MRLKSIKLAGFKSFVEPTTVSFPGNLCAVVGPNGCGKSNVIDAVRWVMGESSASKLRGDAITDVIFSGSAQRKPTTQASIELTFDNSDGRIGGEYATYGEILIRRQLTRDGQSVWFLNGTRCRRRDILDVFLGTGFGPRSYSIIEQGMISQLIEARPEDLRLFLEEAAGISRYRERRRETENRIRHTRENLERLTDLREELERQLQHLQRQARAAERYRALKDEESEIRAQLFALRWLAIGTEMEAAEQRLGELENGVEAQVAAQRRVAADAEELRAGQAEASDRVNQIQQRFYEAGARIARLEESIRNRNQQGQRLGDDLDAIREQQARLETQLSEDNQARGLADGEIERLGPVVAALEERISAVEDGVEEAEGAMRAWQERWDGVTEEVANARQRLEVARGRGEYLERNISRARERMGQLESMRDDPAAQELARGVEALRTQVDQTDAEVRETRAALDAALAERDQLRTSLADARSTLDETRAGHEALSREQAALTAAQRLALGESDDEDHQWLQSHGLDQLARVGERLEVDARWDGAVESALGPWLQALVGELPAEASDTRGRLWMVGTGPRDSTTSGDSLSAQVRSEVAVDDLLRGIRLADNFQDALARRNQLGDGESFITPDGDWVGRNWMRRGGLAAGQTGVLARGRRIEELGQELADAQAAVTAQQARVEELRQQGAAAGELRDQLQRQLADQSSAAAERRSELGQSQVRLEEAHARRQRAEKETADLAAQLGQEEDALAGAGRQQDEAGDLLRVAEQRADALREERAALEGAVQSAREQRAQVRAQLEQERVGLERHTAQRQSLAAAMERLQGQQREGAEREARLQQELQNLAEPSAQDQRDLDENVQQRAEVEEELRSARQALEALESRAGELEKARSEAEEAVAGARDALNRHQLDMRELQVRRTTVDDQMSELGADPKVVAEGLPEDATEDGWAQALERIGTRIARLGAINLAAIDEYQTQQERKTYLDAQNDDLEKALATLENAIRRIDRETRDRFSETFDTVNKKFRELFPKVFGGGDAYLELIGDDPLTAGARVMARPPGKRNASIHLLSGGEKALTALALVFSIFHLNPSPVCMLDEVDAPLDDVNVGRYADLIKEMSSEVQFVYITHNKLSMEMADQLCGVTMQEPGVSRLVTVDIEAAEALAAV